MKLFLILFFLPQVSLALNNISVFNKGRLLEDSRLCSVENYNAPLFYISTARGGESLSTSFYLDGQFESDNLGELPQGSFIFVDPTMLRQRGTNQLTQIEVAKIPHSQSNARRSRSIFRGFQGYIAGDAIARPDGWKFKVEESYIPYMQNEEDAYYLEGKFLQTLKEAGKYKGVICCENNQCSDYPIFKVFKDEDFFYQGTYAIEVENINGEIVRYGEVSSKLAAGLKEGDSVDLGQVIGFIGRLNSGRSMLHFELYDGSRRGALTDRSQRPYQRRSDLVNPTSRLVAWEGHSF